MKYTSDFIKKRIDHVQEHIQNLKYSNSKRSSESKTFHGGWSLGYWEGKLSIYEDLLKEIEGEKF